MRCFLPRSVRCLLLLAVLGFRGGGVCAQTVTFTIDATQDRGVIPAAVYGVNDVGMPGATVHRHGGNRLTGFNWENNASNAGTDYINNSDNYLGYNAGIGSSQTPGALLGAWVNADRAAGLRTIMTLPLAGYVAADMNGSVSQAETAPSARWKQVVADKPGALSLTPDGTDGVIYLEEMVNWLVVNYGTAASGGVMAYNLDNEPALWPSTHPRIHPAKTGYAELFGKQRDAALVATAVDPSAQIYGPVGYGWQEHVNLQDAPDRGNYSSYGTFTNYYLAQMKLASDTAGRRLLHRYDMHWYPEATGDQRIVFGGSGPGSDNDVDARLQAPRSLWDPTFVEKSWITQYSTGYQAIQLLPRLQASIDQYYPGTGLALTEYNYGASGHISGGVAQADVLGILGRFKVAGCYWPLNSDNTFVAAAFKLFRNYDNAGSAFGAISLDATASDNAMAGVHAARASSGSAKLTVVAINRSRTAARTAQFNFTLPTGQTLNAVKVFRLAGAVASVQAVTPAPTPAGASFSDTLPAMSATLYEVQLAIPAGFAAWQQAKFGPDAGNPAIAGDNADPDGDGVPNLLEYVLGGDPKAADPSAPLRFGPVTFSGGAPSSVQVQFNRRKNVTDAQLFLQNASALPGTWSDQDPATLSPTVVSLDDGTEQWTLTLSLSGATQKFFRLKAQR